MGNKHIGKQMSRKTKSYQVCLLSSPFPYDPELHYIPCLSFQNLQNCNKRDSILSLLKLGYFQLPSVCIQQSAIRRFERRAESFNRQGILVHMKSIHKNPCVDY
jgi:hypothetical protein